MKLKLCFWILLFSCAPIFGQIVWNDQFSLTNFDNNPALTGLNNSIRITAQYNNGFSNAFSKYHQYLLFNDFGINVRNGNRIGVGLGVKRDELAALNSNFNKVNLGIAYHWSILSNKKSANYISFGSNLEYVQVFDTTVKDKVQDRYNLNLGTNFSTTRELLNFFNVGISANYAKFTLPPDQKLSSIRLINWKFSADAEIEISDRFLARPRLLLINQPNVTPHYLGFSVGYKLRAKRQNYIELGMIARMFLFGLGLEPEIAYIPQVAFRTQSLTFSASFDWFGDILDNSLLRASTIQQSDQFVLQYQF